MTLPKFRKINVKSYRPGKSRLSRIKNIVKLSANESALGASSKVKKAINKKIDMVDIFRTKDFIFSLTKEAIEVKAEILWTQEGIIHEEAANFGRNAGLIVVMDKCPKKILED